MSNKFISIVGVQVELIPIPRNELKGLNADMLLRFSYYTTAFNNQALCVIQPNNQADYTPLKYKRITEQVEAVLGVPVAILLDSLMYYERERLIQQGVYFIVSDKFAFLPSLIVNNQVRKNSSKSEKLTPAAQYILLYYFLTENVETFTIRELEQILPYNYLALARAVTSLENCGLCRIEKEHHGTKIIRFENSKRELWDKSQPYLSSPVKKVLYADMLPKGDYSISGVNALSHYSHLNAEQNGTVAVWDKFFNEQEIPYNEVEGTYEIEIWKYPTSMPGKVDGNVVDKLSLYLSMKDNKDARIEKELEIIIEEMKW